MAKDVILLVFGKTNIARRSPATMFRDRERLARRKKV